uniref:DNA 3'-5' helicase n=1 Tax=Heterosigma akashiwo TaxID=2829 RepID=A0A7S3XKN7_HETAK
MTADYLRDQGINADYYHAGQNMSERTMVQAAWQRGDVHVVCATIAYGMGIDKPDVRYVLHASLAKSIEGYYQEAGRAGRDGNEAHCVLFFKESDVGSLKRIIEGPGGGRGGYGRGGRFRPPRKKRDTIEREFAKLEEMAHYCMQGECRRKVFAHHFGESYRYSLCNRKCDNCRREGETQEEENSLSLL